MAPTFAVVSAAMQGDAGGFNGVMVFSATTASDRAALGQRVSAWLAQRPAVRVVDAVTTQSSDEAFHCLTITVFYRETEAPREDP